MARTTRLRSFVLLMLLILLVPPLHAGEAERPEQETGLLGEIWDVLVQLLPGFEKLGAGMDPLGVTGPTSPPAQQAGPGEDGELGAGMDPLG